MTRNPEIGNTPAWVLPHIWRLGQVRDTKFGRDVSNKMLLNARVKAFTISELLRENQQDWEGGCKNVPPPKWWVVTKGHAHLNKSAGLLKFV